MASLTVFDRLGKQVGTYDIQPTDLAPRISKQLLHDAVVMYQSNQRLGTVKTKSRAEVAGSTKKMYRQKGTGNARAGSRRSGVRRGGGHIFALRPRDWTYRLPRKALQLATRMALASKIRDDQVTLIDNLAFDQPKTREMAAILKALKIGQGSLLVATVDHDINVYKSARNIDKVSVSPVSGLNALNILTPRRILMTQAAIEAVRERATSTRDGEPKKKRPTREKAAKPARKKARLTKGAAAPRKSRAAADKPVKKKTTSRKKKA